MRAIAVKGGDLLQVANTILLERAQTAGPGQVNLNPQKIYELGNYQSVATIFDIPDLSYSLESVDATAQLECLLTGQDYSSISSATPIDLAKSFPLDVVGQIKPGVRNANPYDVVKSVATPFLNLESLSYKFGLSDLAMQTASLRGDAIYYNPGGAVVEVVAGTNTANQVITIAHPAYAFKGDVLAGTRYILSATIVETGERLFFGADYTETPTGTDPSKDVDVTIKVAVPTTSHVRLVYSTSDTLTYPQNSHLADTAVHPAAIRGRDIKVYVGGEALVNEWSDVQSVGVDWKVTLDKDEQFGSIYYVNQDFFVPDVTGTIQVKPRNPQNLFDKIATVAGLATNTEVAGALTTPPVPVLIVLHAPQDGTPLKTIEIPDARINVPGWSAQVQQKSQITFNLQSDTGVMYVYKGKKTGLPSGI